MSYGIMAEFPVQRTVPLSAGVSAHPHRHLFISKNYAKCNIEVFR